MSTKTPSSNSDSIPWAVILNILVLSLSSAWLVFVHDWNVWEAMFTVLLVDLGILGLLMAVIWIYADPEGRDDFWNSAKHIFHEDYDRTLKYFRIRRRK